MSPDIKFEPAGNGTIDVTIKIRGVVPTFKRSDYRLGQFASYRGKTGAVVNCYGVKSNVMLTLSLWSSIPHKIRKLLFQKRMDKPSPLP